MLCASLFVFHLDRGNDNWLIKYEMPDIDETAEDVSWLMFLVVISYCNEGADR